VTAGAAVEVRGLVKQYGDRAVVDGISLEVAAGELVALLGPNGAGKTTTVEIIEGYRHADAGTARVLGADPWTGGRDLRARVGLMLQGGGIDMRARPRETLVQYAAFHDDPRDPDELVDLVGLRAVAATPFRRLSGGERQRLGLALALVGRPDVVILDEPTAGMDPEAKAATRAIVADLRAAGAAILLTSHDLTDVERMADRIVVLDAGRVVASGSPAELVAGSRPRIRFRLDRQLGDEDLATLARAVGSPVATLEPGRYEIAGHPPTPALVAAVAASCSDVGALVVDLRTSGGSLEEAYLDLLQRARSRGHAT
jgi:ABC-2 type transport system ATP-binding protein